MDLRLVPRAARSFSRSASAARACPAASGDQSTIPARRKKSGALPQQVLFRRFGERVSGPETLEKRADRVASIGGRVVRTVSRLNERETNRPIGPVATGDDLAG